MEQRVVVTGIGAVTALGNTADETWERIKAGKHGFSEITKIDVSDLKVKIGAQVCGFEFPDKRAGRRMDLFSQYGVVAAAEAMAQAGLKSGDNIAPERLGVYVGSGIGGIATLEKEIRKGEEHGLRKVSPVLVPMIIGNMLAGQIAIANNAKASALDIVTACSCGTNAIGEAWRAIRHGYIDAIIAGGAEAPFAPTCFAGFVNMTAMSLSRDADRASIPFDKERDGFVMGEGSAMLILESMDFALSRGANILAEIIGYGSTNDAFHITQPSETGEGAAQAMRTAMETAGLAPEDISYINAHGTSTPLNDLCETRAIKSVFGDAAYGIPVSSTKSMTGHMLGAAGAAEALFCIRAINDGVIPPTAGYRVKDEELDLDYVTDGCRRADVRCALSNSLGFGGHNATIIFKRCED
ncbi:MAG: beta-ketoacyl-ACP synthase II [Clostridiales Family XIII bacterium]|jgi:3-oxoacyl-[acyl-carrier-protein] synthase II|nr:beta-ketoacyl-ACP synthase II [Clostridiales Family XIII bacterium]